MTKGVTSSCSIQTFATRESGYFIRSQAHHDSKVSEIHELLREALLKRQWMFMMRKLF